MWTWWSLLVRFSRTGTSPLCVHQTWAFDCSLFLFFPTDGVVLIDPEYLKERKGAKWLYMFTLKQYQSSSCVWIITPREKWPLIFNYFLSVFVTLTCAFRYGREDLDVLGLTFRKDLFVANVQAFPSLPEEKKSLTRLQERLIKKLGEHAYPFTFEVTSTQLHLHYTYTTSKVHTLT